MSARSTQVRQLASELATRLGLHQVEIRWSGTRACGGFGGWRVEWTNGPTVGAMRTAVERHGPRYPAVPVADLGYDRRSTSLAEAVALLLYVDRDPTRAYGITGLLVQSAYDATGWPERADQVWHDRAYVLLRHAPQAGPQLLAAGAVNALAEHAGTGWDQALAWLDRLVAEQTEAASSNVIDLASRRLAHRCSWGPA